MSQILPKMVNTPTFGYHPQDKQRRVSQNDLIRQSTPDHCSRCCIHQLQEEWNEQLLAAEPWQYQNLWLCQQQNILLGTLFQNLDPAIEMKASNKVDTKSGFYGAKTMRLLIQIAGKIQWR